MPLKLGKYVHKKSITIKDVAAAAGVSVATISLVMRDMGTFPDSTRERVKNIAQEMGYSPNRRAASFRTGRSRTIGYILPSADNQGWVDQWTPMIAQAVLNIILAASERGYAIVVLPPQSQDLLRSFGLDAVILHDSLIEDPNIDTAYENGIYIATYDRPHDPRLSAHLNTGYADMTRAALDEMHKSGAQKPGLLTEPGGMSSAALQVEAYNSWCTAHGCEPVVARGTHDRSDIEQRIDQLLTAGCDAIYSFYGEGLTILNYLHKKKLRVPEDIQLITAEAYDDEANKELGISTTIYHPELMITKPVNMLIDVIEGKLAVPATFDAPWELNLYSSTR